MKKKKSTKTKAATTDKEYVKVAKKFISNKLKNSQINWGLEMKTFSKLYSLYPDASFWDFYKPPIQITSLVFLISPSGQQDLGKQYKLYHSSLHQPNSQKITLEDCKVGDDLISVKKPKTLKDWFRS